MSEQSRWSLQRQLVGPGIFTLQPHIYSPPRPGPGGLAPRLALWPPPSPRDRQPRRFEVPPWCPRSRPTIRPPQHALLSQPRSPSLRQEARSEALNPPPAHSSSSSSDSRLPRPPPPTKRVGGSPASDSHLLTTSPFVTSTPSPFTSLVGNPPPRALL